MWRFLIALRTIKIRNFYKSSSAFLLQRSQQCVELVKVFIVLVNLTVQLFSLHQRYMCLTTIETLLKNVRTE